MFSRTRILHTGDLVDSVSMLAPLGKFVAVQREFLLEVRDDLGVLVEEHGAVAGFEATQSLLAGGPLFFGRDSLDSRLDDCRPELLVLVTKEDDDTGGLRVEGARGVEDGLFNDLLDLGIGDDGFIAELVNGASVLDGVEEFAGHCRGGGCKVSVRRWLNGDSSTSRKAE